MNPSHTFDPTLHPEGSAAAQGRCTHHTDEVGGTGTCSGDAVVSFQDGAGNWQSGCAAALQLVGKEILPSFSRCVSCM